MIMREGSENESKSRVVIRNENCILYSKTWYINKGLRVGEKRKKKRERRN